MDAIKLFVLKYKRRTLTEQIENMVMYNCCSNKIQEKIDKLHSVVYQINVIEDKLNNGNQ